MFFGAGGEVDREVFFICIPNRGNLKSNLNVKDNSSIINTSSR